MELLMSNYIYIRMDVDLSGCATSRITTTGPQHVARLPILRPLAARFALAYWR